LLLTQRYRLTVLLSRPHAPQPNFFLQDEAAFDHQDLLDDRDHCRVTLLSDRRNGIDWPTDCNAFDFNPFAGQSLVYGVTRRIVQNRTLS
jgi:hypothetical protein